VSRIIAGRGKGRRLKTLEGAKTRPTAARVRQTLFDILSGRLQGAHFLDLFAGNGGVGLEALSRGASFVCLVEASPPAVAVVRENAIALGPPGEVKVFCQDAATALRALTDSGARFDVVYLDPPYSSDLYLELLTEVGRALRPGGLVVAEHFHKRALPETIGGLVLARSVRVGDHRLSFYRQEAD
jgi:16S rRNA (guanine966-N2)-methyltransferase